MTEPSAGDRSLRIGMTGAVGLLRALGPRRHRLAGAVGLLAYVADGERRERVKRNHRRLDPGIDAREVARRARASFREYARTNADFIWAIGMSDAEVLANSVVIGREHIDRVRESGAVLALTHHGNWDMGANIAVASGLRLTTVMAPIGSRAITELVIWARERNRLEVFTADRAARGLMRGLQRGRLVALLCDIPGAGPETVVEYCGGPVVFSVVPARLALRSGAPLLPVSCRRGRGGEAPYVVTVHAPVPTAGRGEHDVMQAVAIVLEAAVRELPDQWYPFTHVYADAGGPA